MNNYANRITLNKMTVNETIEDERKVLKTILGRFSAQQTQLIRSRTLLTHFRNPSSEELQEAVGYIQQLMPELSDSTLCDFAAKNLEQLDVEAVFAVGPQFVTITDEMFRVCLKDGGWRGLTKGYPGTNGIIECSRVGLNHVACEALLYFGHQRAARSGFGAYRMLRRRADGGWSIVRTVRAWIS